tara:strand:- start:698 stop:1069 length:372 start_codon:yes stop_codon:yes gene_type:complete
MTKIILIGLGGFLGTVIRYLLQSLTSYLYPFQFPLGTILINVLGSFVIGLIYQFTNQNTILSDDIRLFLTVGILGGFTTFSAFSIDVMLLYQNNGKVIAFIYLLLSVMLSIIAVFAGMTIFKN